MSNIQPLYKGGNPSLPLSSSPYYSRTEGQNLDFDTTIDPPKNYQFVAFRPGFSLQASELNEMQENMQMQMTLTIAMMHNWITSGTGHQWRVWKENSPGGEGGQWDTVTADLPPDTGIGVGGLETGHDPNYQVSGPGWRGATPLHPFYSPYQGGGSLPSVSVERDNSGKYTFTFNPGWWLVESKGLWDGEDENQPTQVSGLKYWVYLDTAIEIDNILPPASNKFTTVGLTIEENYVASGSADGQDPDLADNSNSGTPNSSSLGADRYKVSIKGAASVVVPGSGWDPSNMHFQTRENMNPVCVIREDDNSVRYMNNLLIKPGT